MTSAAYELLNSPVRCEFEPDAGQTARKDLIAFIYFPLLNNCNRSYQLSSLQTLISSAAIAGTQQSDGSISISVAGSGTNSFFPRVSVSVYLFHSGLRSPVGSRSSTLRSDHRRSSWLAVVLWTRTISKPASGSHCCLPIHKSLGTGQLRLAEQVAALRGLVRA